jgi:hypothetical protein
MFRRMFSVLAAAVVLCGGVVAVAAPAQADSAGCVTRAEYRKVHRGMTQRRVRSIFDTRGSFGDGGAGGYSRLYRQCKTTPAVWLTMVVYRVPPHGAPWVAQKDWKHFGSD